jgi:surface polysaccharide O-acyltransferase-like enzyme
MIARDLKIDFIRLFACVLVVATHSRIPNLGSSNWSFFLAGLGYLCRPCIGLFFMISGYLLLPIKIDTMSFLKKKLSKFILPTLIWSLIYIIESFLLGKAEQPLGYTLLSLPFTAQGGMHLWYMYALIGVYFTAPILSTWLNQCSKKEIEIYLLLWGVSTMYPYITYVAKVNTSIAGVLYYCTGYVGYFLLGYYLKRYGSPLRRWYWSLLLLTICLTVPILLRLTHATFDQGAIFGFCSTFVAVMCLIWWNIIGWVSHKVCTQTCFSKGFFKWRKIIIQMSNLSFGVYLIHMLVNQKLLWCSDWLNVVTPYPLQTMITIFLNFCISMIICYGLSYLPGAKYIIGFQNKTGKL